MNVVASSGSFFVGGKKMKIVKIFNNNAVATVSKTNEDLILTGSGIGFQKKIGDEVDLGKIEKKYYYQGGENNAMYQFFMRTPIEYFNVSQEIMDVASRQLKVELKPQIIITLTDHIGFAIERIQNHIELPNLVLPEIKTLYKEEYNIGLIGLKIVKRRIGVCLPVDEAGYIALHILNGIKSYEDQSVLETLQLINGCIGVIQETLHVHFDEDTMDYTRLTTHLKFLAQRVFKKEEQDEMDNDLDIYYLMIKKYPEIFTCVIKIKDYILKEFHYELSDKELWYLMIHIHKITN